MITSNTTLKPESPKLEKWERTLPLMLQVPFLLAFVHNRDVPTYVKLIAIGLSAAYSIVSLKMLASEGSNNG